MKLHVFLSALTAALLTCAPALAQSGAKKPKVPAGRDPGGTAVAILGSGVDYRRPEIHRRLARDGEGEMIGWDMIDNDPIPFEAVSPAGHRLPAHAGSEMAELLLREAPLSRLITVRSQDASTPSLASALAFTRATPARVAAILLAVPPEDGFRLIQDFSKASPHLLLILPSTGAEPKTQDPRPEDMPGLLAVSAATPAGADIQPMSAPHPLGAAVAVSVPSTNAGGGADPAALANSAVVRTAALAARLLHQEPKLDASGLRQRILSFAKPRSRNESHYPTPWLENIERLP